MGARNLELALVLGGNLVGCSIIFTLALTRKNKEAIHLSSQRSTMS
ncbi:hypothetical protein GGI1_10223 [Acidithiobacillus sp. GGI-221]|nr:hypothetical protein GGI1_10223 [Acidithiobacillus sp. GGI-221]